MTHHPTTRTASWRQAAVSTMLLGLLSGCGGGGGDAGSPPPPAPAPPSCTASAPPPAPAPGSQPPQVTFNFSNGAGVNGAVVITLDPVRAPTTVANFLQYVNSGFYNCTVIHRHSPNFVLQGGGYATPLAANTSNPTLKPTNAPIVLEDNAGSNLRFTVAMARTSVPDSATSQFFINLRDNIGLDRTAQTRGYAVFGTVSSGTDVVTAMTAAPCTAWSGVPSGDCLPVPNITILSAAQTR